MNAISGWRLLVGTTVERAKIEGAIYVRLCNGCNEMFRLPAKTVERLDGLPQPEVAYVLHAIHETQRADAGI